MGLGGKRPAVCRCAEPERRQFAADLFVIGFTVFAAVAINANLDQLVGLEAGLDFLENRFGQAVFGNRDDGIQVVSRARSSRRWADDNCSIVNLSKTAFYRMKRTRTSKAWMREHFNDTYVQLARKEGWRSRAAFKLMEIDDKDKLLKRGEVVVDLGATPGGWSQVAVKRVGDSGLGLCARFAGNGADSWRGLHSGRFSRGRCAA
jgi:hypothetical protein